MVFAQSFSTPAGSSVSASDVKRGPGAVLTLIYREWEHRRSPMTLMGTPARSVADR